MNRYSIIRAVSMPNWEVETFGNGHSPAYRCCKVMRITAAIYNHMLGVLDPSTIKGIVTVQGYDEGSFDRAVKDSEAQAAMKESTSKDDILMLFNPDGEIAIRYQLLSRMPEGLLLTDWLRWGLTEIAVHLALPLEEFIGSSASTFLGQSGTEVSAGERRANSKGAGEFTKIMHEKLSRQVVPDTLELKFFERDAEATKQTWEIRKLQSEIMLDWYQAAGREIKQKTTSDGEPSIVVTDEVFDSQIISREEARRWAVEVGVLPEWMSDDEETITVQDDEEANLREARERAKDNQRIVRGAQLMPDEPILHYESWVDEVDRPSRSDERSMVENEKWSVLFESGDEMLKRSVWRGFDFPSHPIVVPLPIKRETVEDAIGESITLRDVVADGLNGQYTGGFTPIAAEVDQDALRDELIRLAVLGYRQAVEDLFGDPDEEQEEESDTFVAIGVWAADRLASLVAGIDQRDDALYYPLSPQTLDVQSAKDIDNAGEGEEGEDELLLKAEARAGTIAAIEAGVAHSFGHFIGGQIFVATHKRWNASTAQIPRLEHIPTYGEVVEFDKLFSHGEFWSQTSFGCQCGITLLRL